MPTWIEAIFGIGVVFLIIVFAKYYWHFAKQTARLKNSHDANCKIKEELVTAFPTDLILEFNRSGGIAGVNDTWEILDNGNIKFTEKHNEELTETVPQSQLNRIRFLLKTNYYAKYAGINFADPQSYVTDDFYYVITIPPNTVISWNDHDKLPDDLKKLVVAIKDIVKA